MEEKKEAPKQEVKQEEVIVTKKEDLVNKELEELRQFKAKVAAEKLKVVLKGKSSFLNLIGKSKINRFLRRPSLREQWKRATKWKTLKGAFKTTLSWVPPYLHDVQTFGIQPKFLYSQRLSTHGANLQAFLRKSLGPLNVGGVLKW